MLVSWNKRKLSESDLQSITKLLLHLDEDRVQQSTRWTFKVAELFQVHWSIRRPLRVSWFGSANSRRCWIAIL